MDLLKIASRCAWALGVPVLALGWVNLDLFVWAVFIWIPLALGLHMVRFHRDDLNRRLLQDPQVQSLLLKAARRASRRKRR